MSRFLSIFRRSPSRDPHHAEISTPRAVARLARHALTARSGENLTSLANESPTADAGMIGLSNEITATAGDGWALIKYGEWPNERGLQRFGKAEAEEMVGYFKTMWNRIKRAFVGMPIYRGHPDFADQLRRERDNPKNAQIRSQLDALVNEAAQKWPDKTVYGTIADMEVREAGLAIKPVLTEAGAALINEQGLKYFSPHWLGRDLPPAADGRTIKAPIFMRSIGLTDRPNIAGTSLVNTAPDGAADATSTHDTTMPKWLLDLLGLANEAPESQESKAQARLTELLARPEPTALVNEQSARTAAETQVTELTAKLTTAETALVNERAELATVRTQRNEALVDTAVKLGRITEASKPVWLSRLERDFATESTALANEQPAVKTAARTDNLGGRKPANTASAQFTALVNEAMPAHGNVWTASWDAVKATPTGKALYEQMSATPAT